MGRQDNIFEDNAKKTAKKRKITLIVCAVICAVCLALDIYFLVEIF